MSIYCAKTASKGVQPWASIIPVGKNIFDLYESRGNVTILGHQTVSTLLDGPEKVVRYADLVIGDGNTASSLTASQRCKGLTILCDTLQVRANATLNMTGKGARVLTNDDPMFPFIDFKIPNQIILSSSAITLAQALAVIKAQGFAPWDQGTWKHIISGLYGFNLEISQDGTVTLLSATGCGGRVLGAWAAANVAVGNTGIAGTNGGMGGGGSGCAWTTSTQGIASSPSGKGCPYSGGSGSGGVGTGSYNLLVGCPMSEFSGPGGSGGGVGGYNAANADTYIGKVAPMPAAGGGGGAGNPGGLKGLSSTDTPGGDGTGGKLVIIVTHSVTIESGGRIEANGKDGGTSSDLYAGGAGSGGGHILIISPSYTNGGTVQAAGGLPLGNQGYRGGAGGAGSVVIKTFTDMGW